MTLKTVVKNVSWEGAFPSAASARAARRRRRRRRRRRAAAAARPAPGCRCSCTAGRRRRWRTADRRARATRAARTARRPRAPARAAARRSRRPSGSPAARRLGVGARLDGEQLPRRQQRRERRRRTKRAEAGRRRPVRGRGGPEREPGARGACATHLPPARWPRRCLLRRTARRARRSGSPRRAARALPRLLTVPTALRHRVAPTAIDPLICARW